MEKNIHIGFCGIAKTSYTTMFNKVPSNIDSKLHFYYIPYVIGFLISKENFDLLDSLVVIFTVSKDWMPCYRVTGANTKLMVKARRMLNKTRLSSFVVNSVSCG